MLTIRYAASAHDLDLARARMQASMSTDLANAEWRDLTDEQRQMFLSIAVETTQPPEGMPHEAAAQ